MVYAMPTRKTREIGACDIVSFAVICGTPAPDESNAIKRLNLETCKVRPEASERTERDWDSGGGGSTPARQRFARAHTRGLAHDTSLLQHTAEQDQVYPVEVYPVEVYPVEVYPIGPHSF